MKPIHIFLALLVEVFIFTSCEKDIIFKGEITAPQIVVNSYITPDSIITAHISESRFFLKDSISFKNITNATVEVWVNGVKKEELIPTEKGSYIGTFKPTIGDVVKLIVIVPSKNTVRCETIIEPAPQIISLDTTDLWTGERYSISTSGSSTNNGPTIWKQDTMAVINGHLINFKLKFKDNSANKNYYRIIVRKKEYFLKIDKITNDSLITFNDNYYFDFSDIVSGNTTNNDPLSMTSGSDYNQYNVFNDELFNGKEYTLTFSSIEDIYTFRPGFKNPDITPFKKEIFVSLQSISKNYYLYLKSVPAALYGDSFFTEPVQIHNNISGGIGIFGSYTSSNAFKYEIKN